jgi:hypothetical protein
MIYRRSAFVATRALKKSMTRSSLPRQQICFKPKVRFLSEQQPQKERNGSEVAAPADTKAVTARVDDNFVTPPPKPRKRCSQKEWRVAERPTDISSISEGSKNYSIAEFAMILEYGS